MKEIDRIKRENTALRKRVAALEEALGKSGDVPAPEFSTYSRILNHSDIGVIIHDFEKVVYANEAVYRHLNVIPDALIGMSPLSFVPDDMPELKKMILQRQEKLKKGGVVDIKEETFVLPSGKRKVIKVGAVPVNYKGKTAAMLTLLDISEAKFASEENRRLLNILEEVPVAVLVTNSQSVIQYVNKHFTTLTGYGKEEAVGQRPSILKSGRYPDEFYKKLYNTLNSGKVWTGEIYDKKKNGEFFQGEFRIKAIFDDRGQVQNYFSLFFDITEKVQMMDELKIQRHQLNTLVKQRTRELEEKNKSLDKTLQALTFLLEDMRENQEKLTRKNLQLKEAVENMEVFSYSISHDLKNPVYGIRDLVRFILKENSDRLTPNGIKYARMIDEQAGAMADLIDHLLQFARTGIETPDVININMEPLLYSLFDEEKKMAGLPNAELKIGELHNFDADYPLMKQVVSNLFSNALKFSKNSNPPTVFVTSEIRDDSVIYHFKDNGTGFDEKYNENIFDILFRAHDKKQYKGNGIGLAIVKRIVERHGGEVFAKGNPGEGAEISFRIPVNSILKKTF